MQQTLFRLRQAWNPLSLVFSLVDPVINPSLPSGLFEMRLLPKRNARKCHKLRLGWVWVWFVQSVWKWAVVGDPARSQQRQTFLKERNASEFQTMHHYRGILSLCPGRGWCAAFCSVCSQCLVTSLPCCRHHPCSTAPRHCMVSCQDGHLVTWSHGHVNTSQTFQTDVVRCVKIMQTLTRFHADRTLYGHKLLLQE